MARFDKLEFDEDFDDEAPSAEPLAELKQEKDEHHWLDLADQHRRSGHYENALRFYSRALEVNKTLVTAWVGQIQMLVQLKEYPQASTWSKKSLELFPNHGDILAGQAQAECRLGDFKRSNALIDSALRLRGESAYQWQVRGELMVALKQKTDRHCFDKAQIACSDYLVPLETALIYVHYREYAKAQQRINTALEKQPDSYYAWYLLGLCQENTGLRDAAVRSYEQCVQLSPNHQNASQKLANLRSQHWSLANLFRRIIHRN